MDRAWYTVIKEYVDARVTEEEYENHVFEINPPDSKESYFYRKIYAQMFNSNDVIPGFWKMKYVETNDPSARELAN